MGGVLALDCALATGVAYEGPTPGLPVTETLHCMRPFRAYDRYCYGLVFADFAKQLRAIIRSTKPEIVACEAPLPVMGRGSKARDYQTTPHIIRLLYGLCAVAEIVAFDQHLPYTEETARTIKHHFTDDASATKADMLRRCKILGWPVRNDDEADAAALWHLVNCKRNPKFRPQIGHLFARAE